MCQSHGPLPSEGGENPGPSPCPPLWTWGLNSPSQPALPQLLPSPTRRALHPARGSSSRTRISSSPTGGLAGFPHKAMSRPQDPQDGVEALKSPTLCVLLHHHKAVRRREPTIPNLSPPCSPIPTLTAHLQDLACICHSTGRILHMKHSVPSSPLSTKSPHPSPSLLAARTPQSSSHILPCPVELPRATPTLGNLQDRLHSSSSVRCATIHSSTPHTNVLSSASGILGAGLTGALIQHCLRHIFPWPLWVTHRGLGQGSLSSGVGQEPSDTTFCAHHGHAASSSKPKA